VSELVRLFFSPWRIVARSNGGDVKLEAVAYKLAVDAEHRSDPGPGAHYVFTELGSHRMMASDPRESQYFTRNQLMGWQSHEIDLGRWQQGRYTRINLVGYPRHKDGSLVASRELAEVLMYFANLAPSRRFPMPVAVKVAHAEAFLAAIEERWPSQG
jgi:hypothetical protein